MGKKADLYIRFGHFDREPSMNWNTGEYEKGISVYSAFLKDGVVFFVDEEWESDIENSWEVFDDRAIYALTGRVKEDTGSDGEPLLIPSSIVVRGTRQVKLTAGLEIQKFGDSNV